MPLMLNSLLAQVEVAPASVRMLRHQDKRAKRRTPYELWRDDRPAFERYQGTQSFENRTGLTAGYWLSFVVTPDGDTLLAGFYRATYRGVLEHDLPWAHADGFDAAGTADVWDLAPDERLADLAGRLVIEWGPVKIKWIQRCDTQNKVVLEIREAFREPTFPGPARLIIQLSQVDNIYRTWAAVLRTLKGVYLLTCPRTGEQYVGSATGESGFHGRWLSYAQDGHGGNIALKQREPSDFQISILEVAGSGALKENIFEMEDLWKRKLGSRATGLNRN